MTDERYRAYRRVRTTIVSGAFTDTEREILLDAAEGVLLARSARADGLLESTVCISSVIEHAVRDRRLDRRSGVALAEEIRACGPAKDVAAGEHSLEAAA